jgi:cytochrome c554/c'-like protein
VARGVLRPVIMRKILRESEHLVRLALVLAAGILIFLVARRAIVPPSFGQYGHFRGDALAEIRARPVSFAGQAACEACHDPIVQTRKEGKHARVACEACHGPLAKHTEDISIVPQRPNAATLCARCHEAEPAKPKGFPQVVTKEHAGDASCVACHNPHRPKI